MIVSATSCAKLVMDCDFGTSLQSTRIKVSVAVTERATTKLQCRYLDYH